MKKSHTNVTHNCASIDFIDDKQKSKNLRYYSTLLKKKREIQAVFANGTKYTGKYATLIAIKSEPLNAPSKFLYTVIRNVRTKSARNAIKRKAREVIRAMYSDILCGYHIAIIVHDPNVTFQTLKEDITDILSLKMECLNTHTPRCMI